MGEVENAAILFAKGLIDWAWDDGPSTDEGQEILDAATSAGLIRWRAPTAAELADDEWWGHEFQLKETDAGSVGEYTPDFRSAISKAKGETT